MRPLVDKIDTLTIRALDVPFVQSFEHATKDRRASDAIIVEVSSGGTRGYGEGLARDYVTGETVERVFHHVREVYWPRVRQWSPHDLDAAELLRSVAECLDVPTIGSQRPIQFSHVAADSGSWVPHAARCAVELALVDLWLKLREQNVSALLPAQRPSVEYSGVISSGSIERAVALARKCRSGGLRQLKIKVGDDRDEQRVAAIRDVVGPDCSLRVDANAAWDLETAIKKLSRMAVQRIDACEEPLGRARFADLPALKRTSPVPIIVDESLVTADDAAWLLDNDACHGLNLRLSKLGGLWPTLRLAKAAAERGVFCQLGSHVGETSILAAAGRHLAYHLPDLRFVEGSFGSLILSQDIASPSVKFGYGGKAEPLSGKGLGCNVVPERLLEYTTQTWSSG